MARLADWLNWTRNSPRCAGDGGSRVLRRSSGTSAAATCSWTS